MAVIAQDQLPRTSAFTREFVAADHGVHGFSFLLVEALPGAGPAVHRHAYDEVCIVQEGRARYTLGDEELEAGPGDIVIVPAGTPHAFVNIGDGPLKQVDIHAADRFVTEWL